ncbi:transport and Golgi organization protein 6 homolog [Osmerus eperlanus]|uniref:transport and Golgi organization protein 6 homolog n=1 Tax=Osmerus eperlanus TaxID=29151 RepID=UPI002E129D97
MTTAILSALNILIKPLGEAAGRNTNLTQQEALVAALQTNLNLLEERLHGERELEELRGLREEVQAKATWVCRNSHDPTWSFVQEALLLLLSLSRHLALQLQLFNQAPPPAARLPTPEMAPPLPPDVLSVSQQKTLGAALQFVVSLGLCPYLAPGVGVPLGRRTALGSVAEGLVRAHAAPAPQRRLLTTTRVLLELAELSSLATLVFTRHLGDVMAALCQLGYRPKRHEGAGAREEKELSTEERQSCRQALQSLLGKVYQPIVIKELLILQGGPKQAPPGRAPGGPPGTGAGGGAVLGQAPPWLRRLCGQLLSERLMQPGGVQAVVRAVLEGSAGGDSDWRTCDGVARILAACPQQSLSADSYYRLVCPQVVELLHIRDKITAQQFQRVATRAALTMVEDRPEFAQRYLLDPLLSPLQRCSGVKGECKDQGPVEERDLTRCVEDVFKVCVVGNRPSPVLLEALGGLVPVLFALFCFTKQNVSHLRAPCQEILLWYLTHCDPPAALAVLRKLSGLGGAAGGGAGGVAPRFTFCPGSEGGAKVTAQENSSDEDEALYERLSGEQWRLECLVQLLGQLKDSILPGELFLGLLQELTSWAAEEEAEEEQEVDVSAMTLLEAEQHREGRVEGRGHRLALLQLLAVLSEGLPHTLLLREPTQVVVFMESLLQRACVGLAQGPGTEGPVESQTLRMGIGLVAAMLSGPQLKGEDYSSMSRLLPPLEELSQKHPDRVIQELASDLRAVIATHGAYRPDNLAHAPRRQDHAPQTHRTHVQGRPQSSQSDTSSPQSQTSQSDASMAAAPQTHISNLTTPSPHTGKPPPQPPRTQPPHAWSPSPAQSGAPRPGQTAPLQTPRGSAGGGVGPDRGPSEGRGLSSGPLSMSFSDWLLEACDPDVPTRAVALRAVTWLVVERDAEAVQAQDKLLSLFLENLDHEDSFVYLSAIQGLAVLADSYPEKILQRLLGEYDPSPLSGPPPQTPPDPPRSLETRLKVGEVLMRASRAMGELAPHLGRPLLVVFLRGTRDEDHSVRASCLANLGELCQRLDYALGPLVQELSTCLTSLIKSEKEAEVRRAAVHVITLLLRGLSHKTTQVLSEVLLDLYRALKWAVRSDRDPVTVLHAQLALEELDDIMKTYLFPRQKLEKKIVVLP